MITPSFNLTATERVLPKLALDFTTASLDSRVTFTRSADTATRVNSSGLIETVLADTPRFDYDPVTFLCKGLLVEESRQNLLTYSQDFSDASWIENACVPSYEGDTSPSGSTDAAKLTDGGSAYIYQNTSRTSGVTYTSSVFAKAGTHDVVAIGNGGNYTAFNLTSGTVTTLGTGVTATITPFSDGWYRCTATYTESTTGNVTFRISVYQGATNDILYIWGAQLEAGAFATSYIPTTTAALTRNADVATMTGTNFSDWFNASEGTFAASFTTATTATAIVCEAGSNDDGTRMAVYKTSAQKAGFFVTNGTVTQASLVSSANFVNKIVAAYKVNSFAMAADGAAALTDTAGSVPTVSVFQIGRQQNTATAWVNGCIESIYYYNQRLTNAETQAFSKG